MKNILLVLLLCVTGCATPIRVVETLVTDSATGKTTKVIQKFYDSSHVTRDVYVQDYSSMMFSPYYDPFFYDPIYWYSPRYLGPIVAPVKPRVIIRNRPVRPRGGWDSPGSGFRPSTPVRPSTPRANPPRPLPPGPRGSYTPQPRSFSTPPAVRPVERGQAPTRSFVKPDNRR
jgi:hypothetical protein